MTFECSLDPKHKNFDLSTHKCIEPNCNGTIKKYCSTCRDFYSSSNFNRHRCVTNTNGLKRSLSLISETNSKDSNEQLILRLRRDSRITFVFNKNDLSSPPRIDLYLYLCKVKSSYCDYTGIQILDRTLMIDKNILLPLLKKNDDQSILTLENVKENENNIEYCIKFNTSNNNVNIFKHKYIAYLFSSLINNERFYFTPFVIAAKIISTNIVYMERKYTDTKSNFNITSMIHVSEIDETRQKKKFKDDIIIVDDNESITYTNTTRVLPNTGILHLSSSSTINNEEIVPSKINQNSSMSIEVDDELIPGIDILTKANKEIQTHSMLPGINVFHDSKCLCGKCNFQIKHLGKGSILIFKLKEEIHVKFENTAYKALYVGTYYNPGASIVIKYDNESIANNRNTFRYGITDFTFINIMC